jgi:hypothetical protein
MKDCDSRICVHIIRRIHLVGLARSVRDKEKYMQREQQRVRVSSWRARRWMVVVGGRELRTISLHPPLSSYTPVPDPRSLG